MNVEVNFREGLKSLLPKALVLSSPHYEDILKSATVTQTRDQFEAQAVELGIEIFGPSMAFLMGSIKNQSNTASICSLLEIEELQKIWLRIVDIRRRSLELALARIGNFARAQGATIQEVKLLDGDPHNGGQTPVMFLVFNGTATERYVYKATNPAAHEVIYSVFERICARLDKPNPVKPLLVAHENYSIREYVHTRSALDSVEQDEYFYNFGILISVATLLEMTDLHFENVIAGDAHPMLIDTEFLLLPSELNLRKWNFVNSGLFSPVISPLNQKSEYSRINGRLDAFTGSVHFGYMKNEKFDGHVVTSTEGEYLKILAHARFLEMGARDGFREALNARKDVLDNCARSRLSQCKHRILIRNTSLYKILQLRLWTPSPVSLADRKKYVRDVLSKKISLQIKIDSVGHRQEVIDAEMLSLLCGDIPFFWSEEGSTDLHHESGPIASAVFQHRLQARLALAYEAASKRQPRFNFERLLLELQSWCLGSQS